MTMMGGTQTDPLPDAGTPGKKGKKKGKKKKLSAAEKKLVNNLALIYKSYSSHATKRKDYYLA